MTVGKCALNNIVNGKKKIWNTIYGVVLDWSKKTWIFEYRNIHIQRFGEKRKEDEENVSEYG